MKLSMTELLENTAFTPLTDCETADISGCYICDLLSWAMSNVQEGDAWLTVQGHINVAAVARLTNAACVIVCEGASVEADTIKKCEEGGIPLLITALSAYKASRIIAAFDS